MFVIFSNRILLWAAWIQGYIAQSVFAAYFA